MTQVEIQFEEVTPIIEGVRIDGMMLYGKAILASSYPDENSHEFYVDEITLDADRGGFVVRANSIGQFHRYLFKAISAELQNDKTDLGRFMQATFSEAVRDERQPDPDAAREERRERVMEDAR